MFRFVTVTHPEEIKEKRRQGTIRKHAIRHGLKKTREEKVQRKSNFVHVGIDAQTGKLAKTKVEEYAAAAVAVARAPAGGLLDPFNTLPGDGERLRILMRDKSAKQAGEPVFCVEDAGRIFFQGMDNMFRDALADPTMFHALSFVLELAANNYLPNVECLVHRGETLSCLRKRIGQAELVPEVSTLSAMLMVISYEYRVDGSSANSIGMHLSGVKQVMARMPNAVVGDAIKRALFWQDLYSCLFVGTTRLLSHEEYPEYTSVRDARLLDFYVLLSGFGSVVQTFPKSFRIVLEDLNVLCFLLDTQCRTDALPIEEFPIDGYQASIESRLVDLRHALRTSGTDDPIYEACLLVAFLCTYKLSTGIWEGCFIPEWCASQALGLISRSKNDLRWDQCQNLMLWLLFVAGALAQRRDIRAKSKTLMRGVLGGDLMGIPNDWEQLKGFLKSFIWSTHSMQPRFRCFWEELRSATAGDAFKALAAPGTHAP